MNCFLVVLLATTFFLSSGCNKEANRAKDSVDQSLKAMGVKKTDMSIFVVDPAAVDRAYISVTATWNFADSSGQPQKENLGFIMKKNGDAWQIQNLGIKYTDDKNTALILLKGAKPGKS